MLNLGKISVILPVYKTALYLVELHMRLVKVFQAEGLNFELIYVDDASPDNSWNILQEIAKQDCHAKIIKLSRNFGQHPAIAAALDNLQGEIVVLMDTDLQDRPEDIPTIIKELQLGCDVVYSRKSNPDCESWFTRFTSQLFHKVISKSLGCRIPKNIGTFRVFSKKFLLAISKYTEHGILFGPLMFHAGFSHRVVDLQRDPRIRGESGYTFSKRLSLAMNALVSYTDLPHRWLLKIGAFTIMGSVVYGVMVILFYFLNQEALMPGLNLIVFLLTFLLGTTMLSLGVIGTYVFRIYQEVLARPRYLIEETVNF